MSICDFIREEFEHEMASTRKVLAVCPEEKLPWQPHQKSMTLGRLAGHVAEIPRWVSKILEAESFDIMPGGVRAFQPLNPTKLEEILQAFDEHVSKGRALLAQLTEEQLSHSWSLLFNGKSVLTKSRYGALRFLALNHMIHHRAQLTVYLRLCGVAVPGLYGPSADEKSTA